MSHAVCLAAVFFFSLFLMPGVTVSALDASFRFMPEVVVPTGSEGESVYSIGGGGSIIADFDAFMGLAPYAEAGLSFLPTQGAGEMLTLTSGAFGSAFSFHPVPRLKLRAAGGGGLYQASAFDKSRYGVFWSARAEAGYRFSPTFSLLASAGYSSYLNGPSPSNVFVNAVSIGLTVDLALGSPSRRSSGLLLVAEQKENVFPIRHYAYGKQALGTITLSNHESAEIRDLEVFFKSEGLTSSAVLCGRVPVLRRGASVELPLYAAFGERILEFTENAKAQGEFTVAYKLLDTRIERTFSTAVSFNHRNAMTWANPRAAAAFVSPNDAAVLDLSKFVAGLVRDRIRPDIDHALQYGIGLFEGLRLTGLSYAEDPSAPYRECRNDPSRIDYIQYPYQTFAYRGGDSDDLALLYAASLSSVGLRAALLPLPDKAYAAFALDSSELEAKRFFSDQALFAWRGDKVWVVVDPTLLREGFLAAWRSGARAWSSAVASGAADAFFEFADAWTEFKPVGIGGVDLKIPKPREDRLELAFENAVGRFVAAELAPRVERFRSEMGPSGGNARQLNALGILYARYGLFKDARAAFSQAVAQGSRSALVNLANVEFLLKDYNAAARLYADTLRDDPENKAALLGLARSRYELDAYADADELFARVNRLDPALASKYAYLSSSIGAASAARASAAADRGGSVPWQDEE